MTPEAHVTENPRRGLRRALPQDTAVCSGTTSRSTEAGARGRGRGLPADMASALRRDTVGLGMSRSRDADGHPPSTEAPFWHEEG